MLHTTVSKDPHSAHTTHNTHSHNTPTHRADTHTYPSTYTALHSHCILLPIRLSYCWWGWFFITEWPAQMEIRHAIQEASKSVRPVVITVCRTAARLVLLLLCRQRRKLCWRKLVKLYSNEGNIRLTLGCSFCGLDCFMSGMLREWRFVRHRTCSWPHWLWHSCNNVVENGFSQEFIHENMFILI